MIPVEGVQGERRFADDAFLHHVRELPACNRQQPVVHSIQAATGLIRVPVQRGVRVFDFQKGRSQGERFRCGSALLPLPGLTLVHRKAGCDDHRHHVAPLPYAELSRDLTVERRRMPGVMDVVNGVPQALARTVAQFLYSQGTKGQPPAPGGARHVTTATKVHVEHQHAVVVEIRDRAARRDGSSRPRHSG